MGYRSSAGIIAGAIVLVSALCLTLSGALAFDQTRYPDWAGQWTRFKGHPGNFDPSKPRRSQQAPLTPEYQAIFEANLREQDEGKQGSDPTYVCLSPGMPRIMNIYEPMEIVITPDSTHILTQHIHDARRIFTDGRDWPTGEVPTFAGYSVGRWIDEDGDGRFDVLEIETRGFKGPRVYDSSDIPLHADNQSVIRERLYLDKADPDILHDQITVMDHALTRPWTVTKSYRRSTNPHVEWTEYVCADGQSHVQIANDNYYLSAGGLLMPARKGQAPPDLRYFKQTRK
jgi:hypothetical protein